MRRSTRALGPVMETYKMYLWTDDKWWENAGGRPHWAIPGSAVRRMQRPVRFGTGNQIPPPVAQPAQPAPAAAAPIRLVARRRAALTWTAKMRYVLNKLLSEEPAVPKDDIVVAFNKACIRHITRCGVKDMVHYGALSSQASMRVRKRKAGGGFVPVPQGWRVILADAVGEARIEERRRWDRGIVRARR